MYIASIDCGTTNTRVYIINEEGKILGKGVREVGVRDTAISGSKVLLKEGLKEAFYDALSSAGFELKDISFAISAGMITSEIGLHVVPHRETPAGINDLAQNLVKIQDTEIFPVELPIYFIPGIKNKFDAGAIGLADANSLDFMRGEEAQVAGILTKLTEKKARTLTVLSSHTKFIPIDEEGRVQGSLTTISGQIYAAVKKETFIGKSIRQNDGPDEPEGFFDKKIVENAFKCIHDSGLIRTLMLSRFMDVLIKTQWYERKLFIESAIAADDLRAVEQFDKMGYSKSADMILVGHKSRCMIYQYILKEHLGWDGNVTFMSDIDEIDQLNIQGSLHIARIAGIL